MLLTEQSLLIILCIAFTGLLVNMFLLQRDIKLLATPKSKMKKVDYKKLVKEVNAINSKLDKLVDTNNKSYKVNYK